MVGPLPPPLHGVSVLTQALLGSPLAERYELVHLDTRDDRGVSNIGRADVMNAWLALTHGARFAAMLARTRPDAVYVPISQNSLGFLRDALFLGPAVARRIPIVLHFHGGSFDRFVRGSRLVRPLIRALVARSARAIVVGEALADMLETMVPAERVRIVPNGVPDPGCAADRPTAGRLRVLFIGNLRPDKGYIDLLEAGMRLLAQGRDVDLTFAGDVSDPVTHRSVLRRYAPQDSHVHFIGKVGVDQRNALLRSANVLVLPSRDEGHPLVVLEAMAAGLPVIASRISTLPETVVDGETGLLVDPGDPAGVAAALQLLTDDGVRLRMGRNARDRYMRHYTIDHWTARMTTVFDELVAT